MARTVITWIPTNMIKEQPNASPTEKTASSTIDTLGGGDLHFLKSNKNLADIVNVQYL